MTMTNRFDSMGKAVIRANDLTESTGELHIAIKTDYVFSPYQAVRMPQVGDEVSMGFNGDYYPCGKIAKISQTYNRITTDEGTIFTRVAPNRWKRGGKNGTFSLVQGVHDKHNPHF